MGTGTVIDAFFSRSHGADPMWTGTRSPRKERPGPRLEAVCVHTDVMIIMTLTSLVKITGARVQSKREHNR